MGLLHDQIEDAKALGHRPGRGFIDPHKRSFEHEATLHAEVQRHLKRFDRIVPAIGIARKIGFAHAAHDAAEGPPIRESARIGEKEQVAPGHESVRQAFRHGCDFNVMRHRGGTKGGHRGADIKHVIGSKAGSETLPEGSANAIAAVQFHTMALAVEKAERFDMRKLVQRPGQAGCAILAAGEQYQHPLCAQTIVHDRSYPAFSAPPAFGRSYAYLTTMASQFSEDEVRRYARHILLDEVGGAGQARLRDARVLIVGVGGLGSPLALYLAAAGIGHIGLADDDTVEVSNLQRQIAHTVARLGQPKTLSAQCAIADINPLVHTHAHTLRVTPETVQDMIAGYDIVCDGTDNFDARFALADACYAAAKTLVSAAVLRFEGQLATFKRDASAGDATLPCYRCLYPAPPPPGLAPSCAEAGVLGPVTGVMGTLQATEVLKEILGIGESLAGRLLIWDALGMRFRVVRLMRDPGCSLCGDRVRATAPQLRR